MTEKLKDKIIGFLKEEQIDMYGSQRKKLINFIEAEIESSRVELPVSVRDHWNRCFYCGKFIAYEEFTNGKADNVMILPDSAVSYETWEAYHLDCKAHQHPIKPCFKK